MSQDEKKNIILTDLVKAGIANPFLNAGIIAVIQKESNFTPKKESSYKNTSAERLKSIFVTRLKNLTDADIDKVKTNDIKFFNIIYGGKAGNDFKNDGFIFRGAGLNQLTGKANFDQFGKLAKIELVNKPELLDKFENASLVNAQYFKYWLNLGISKGSLKNLELQK